MEEEFDIVDDSNRALGYTKPRSLVHRDGDWHRTVHIYIYNQQGNILVHLRSPQKDLSPNMWDTRFGGHVSAGMTVEQTVIRELQEEIGLQVELSDLVVGTTVQTPKQSNSEFCTRYYYLFSGDVSILKFNDNEVVGVEWRSPKSIRQSMDEGTEKWTGTVRGFENVVAEMVQLHLID